MTKQEVLAKLEFLSVDEVANELIILEYQQNMIVFPKETFRFTQDIVNYAGSNSLTPVLMMAKVNSVLYGTVKK